MTATTSEARPLAAPYPSTPHEAVVTDLAAARGERALRAQQRRAAARSRDLTALLRDRPDLAGVHLPADLAVEAVRWGV
ncbi:MAG: hypothetical protein WB441_07955 [Nocardioidaceae bacterium]